MRRPYRGVLLSLQRLGGGGEGAVLNWFNPFNLCKNDNTLIRSVDSVPLQTWGVVLGFTIPCLGLEKKEVAYRFSFPNTPAPLLENIHGNLLYVRFLLRTRSSDPKHENVRCHQPSRKRVRQYEWFHAASPRVLNDTFLYVALRRHPLTQQQPGLLLKPSRGRCCYCPPFFRHVFPRRPQREY